MNKVNDDRINYLLFFVHPISEKLNQCRTISTGLLEML